MLSKISNITILILLIMFPLQGQKKLTLDQCVLLALKNNPLIQSFIHQHRSYLARINQAKAIPQPEISLDYDLQPELFNFKDSGESYIGINQLIEFPGRRMLRGKVAKKDAEAFLCEFESVKCELIFQVKKAFFQLLSVFKNREYVGENFKLAGDFMTKANEKYLSGDVAKIEVLRAKVEAAKAENELKVAQNQIKLAKASLNFYLARDKFQAIEIKGDLKRKFLNLDLSYLIKKALAFRPEIKKVKVLLEKEKLNKKQSTLGFLPDFSLGLARHRIFGEENTWDINLSFEIPVFFWQKQKGEIAEASSNIESLKSELSYVELNVTLEVENAHQNAISCQNQITLFEEEILKEAEEVYRMSMISYREGKVGSLELMDARRTLIELKKAYAETLLNYQLALVELEKFVGTALEGEKND